MQVGIIYIFIGKQDWIMHLMVLVWFQLKQEEILRYQLYKKRQLDAQTQARQCCSGPSDVRRRKPSGAPCNVRVNHLQAAADAIETDV